MLKYLLIIYRFTLYIVGCLHCFLCALCHEGASIIRTSYAVIQWSNEFYRSVVGTSHVRCHMVYFAFIDYYYHICHGFQSIPWFRLFGVFFSLSLLKGKHPDKWVCHSGWFWCFMASSAPCFRIVFL